MGARDDLRMNKVYESVDTVGTLLQLIEEDVITMESTKTDLQTEILLLKMYYKKLPLQMQKHLADLLKLSMA